ncbi:divergent PAP2 family protein [Halothermothrix orenii]|uniref:Acid phosphatase/vanadium-dependent haloperoxidase related n=1 Tax=Halothermothrix orenii (strain H 168 / OCM 544 / DSM 9562) TaxID=373903 RepID=B8CY18_HALOH|nr:divergent PAP2 family protein [Halothermothrix orenii]ACL70187.1 acid phosphatase/vanadium-dependent haloperoxidase related [Halothermothrix orenii H 168]
MSLLEISLLSLFIAQVLKIFTTLPPDFSRIIGSGGMPSSHASFVSTLSTTVGLNYGFDSDLFAIVTVFSLIIIYDAGGVRRAVGEQANVLNHLIKHLELGKLGKEKKIIKKDLRELIGHTPFEVLAGTILGVFIALINYYYL